MTLDGVMEYARTHLSPEGLRVFSDQALWFAAESGKPTAIPMLTLVASVSLLIVILEIALIAFVIRLAASYRRTHGGTHE